VLLILGIILTHIIVNGLPVISWEFLTTGPRNLGRDGGIFPAIVGTLYLVAGAIALALPLGWAPPSTWWSTPGAGGPSP